MKPNNSEPRWWHLQQGQAMMEYWPTIPVAIAVMIAAGLIAQMVNSAFLKTTDALNRAGLDSEICNLTTETVDGGDEAEMEGHTVQLSSNVYDPETDTTTVTYTVTSGGEHAISHWVLALPHAVYSKIIDYPADELMSWVDPDPTTGVVGVKFDKEYEGDSGGGGGGKDADKGGGSDKKPPKKGRIVQHTRYVSVLPQLSTADTREITLVLSGQFAFEPVTVVVKASTDVYSSTISAPVAVATPDDKDVTPTDLLKMDSLNEGCAK